MLSFLTYILFTLLIETFALKKYFYFSWMKAFSLCVGINIAAFFTSSIAQSFAANKLDPSFFYIFNIYTNYFKFALIFILISFLVKVATEAFICRLFAKEVSIQKVVIVVLIMNVITFLPYSIKSYANSKPEIPEPFNLVESANWLADNPDIVYVDPFKKNISKYRLNSTNLTVLAETMPINGYRVSMDKNSIIVLHATNSVIFAPAKEFNIPVKILNFEPAITNPYHIAISPDMKWFAVQGKEKANIYSFPVGKLTNAADVNLPSNFFNDSWAWHIKTYNEPTNTFSGVSATVTVFKTGGVKINGEKEIFKINGMGEFRPYHGVGFIDNDKTFLFEYGYELMGLNLKTKTAGHLTDAIGCVLLK